MGYSEFKGKVLQYYNTFQNTCDKTQLFKTAIDKAVYQELPQRDNERLFQIRDFTNTEGLKLSYISDSIMCKYSEESDCLVVGTVGPAWQRGWKKISNDPFVADQIDNFFHFACQYIYRSMQINVIGAIALAFHRDSDFRGNTLRQCSLPYRFIEYKKFKDSITLITTRRGIIFSHYLKIINALDPFVNKTIYYYVRSMALKSDGYLEESITCLDNVIDTINQSIKQRLKLPTLQRQDMYKYVKRQIVLSDSIVRKLEDLYQLRCHFSAHPAQSKWWDFGEIYDNDIELIESSVKHTIVKYLTYECNNRIIQASPVRWSDWFVDKCNMLFDSIWFHKLSALND